MNTPNADADHRLVSPAAESEVASVVRVTIWWFARVFVAALGIVLGVIVSVFVGLVTGWISIHC